MAPFRSCGGGGLRDGLCAARDLGLPGYNGHGSLITCREAPVAKTGALTTMSHGSAPVLPTLPPIGPLRVAGVISHAEAGPNSHFIDDRTVPSATQRRSGSSRWLAQSASLSGDASRSFGLATYASNEQLRAGRNARGVTS